MAGADPFAGLAAGDALAALSLQFDTTTPGAHAETITLHPTSANASGFLGNLPAVTLTVTDLVPAGEGGGGTDGHSDAGHHRAGHGHGDGHHDRHWALGGGHHQIGRRA
ncbi:hypothetical protein [Dankookia sp. P2]|uniref:hypothetical protein n=1 Tax=Dankookia sp. P2 TaxID=3423955 RepID=UPI003D6682DC